MTARRPSGDAVERALLGLLRQDLPAPDLPDADWQTLGEMAAEHRLAPLLHAERGSDLIIPEWLRADWAEAHRHAALVALAQRRDLLLVHGLLAQRGIAHAALKGACLAWQHYPDPAIRPNRDLDLLVDPNRAEEAWQALREAGFTGMAAGSKPDVDTAVKHLPGLVAPGGTLVELHVHCWELPAQVGHRMPPRQDGAILASAAERGDDDVPVPASEHLMAHHVVHAAYSNWLDGGPLALVDLTQLVGRENYDWSMTWQQAEAGGWARGLALLLALADHWRTPGIVQASGCRIAVDDDVLQAAPGLLLQPLDKRSGAALLAGGKKGAGALADRYRRARDEGLSRWMGSRIARTAGDLADAETRKRAKAMKRLGKWLDSGA